MNIYLSKILLSIGIGLLISIVICLPIWINTYKLNKDIKLRGQALIKMIEDDRKLRDYF